MIDIAFLSNKRQFQELYENEKEINTLILLSNFHKDRLYLKKVDQTLFFGEIIDTQKIWLDSVIKGKNFFDKLNTKKVIISNKLLGFNGISLLDLDSIRYLSGHTEILANIFFKIQIINEIIKNFNPENILIFEPHSNWENIIEKNDITNIHSSKKREENRKRKNIDVKLNIYNHKVNCSLPSYLFSKIIPLKDYCSKEFFKKKKHGNNIEILFYLFNKKFLDAVIPLINSINNDNNYKILVLIAKNFDGLNRLKNNNINFEYFDNYLDFEIIEEAKKIYFKKLSIFEKNRDAFKNDFLKYKNLDISNSLEKHILETFYNSYSNIRDIMIMKKIIRTHNSKIFFSPHFSENRIKSLNYASKEMKINSLNLFSGTTGFSSIYGTINCNKILVSGIHSKNDFIKWGINKENILITGMPIFDDLLNRIKDTKEISNALRNELNIKKKFKIVTYLTQSQSGRFGEKERKKEIETIYEAVKEFENIYFIIKLHPTEKNIDVYKKMAYSLKLRNYSIIKNEIPLDNLLISSEIALTKNSTSGFNALIAGCKLIVLGFEKSILKNNFFIEGNVGFPVTNRDELKEKLNKILCGEYSIDTQKIKSFINHHFYKLDQKSHQRIKQVIYDFLE